MTSITVVVGAQFGSEGKGAISGYLCRNFDQGDVAIRVAGPNAGHTVIGKQGETWKLRVIPVAAVTSPNCQLHLAAGSEVDVALLMHELSALDEAGYNATRRLTIHPSATVLHPRYLMDEQSLGIINKIGSTGKGVGAARAARAMREASTVDAIGSLERLLSAPGVFDLEDCANVLIEGTQGYGLGLHTGYYPQVTSSDCRAIDFLAMAGVNPWYDPSRELKIQLVARAYPIRVAGNSGPLSEETTWAELGLAEERTTVTNNLRRVGQWDEELVIEAIQANGGGAYHAQVSLAFTMIDHLFPDQAGKTELDDDALTFIEKLEDRLECHIDLVGTGPNTVVEL